MRSVLATCLFLAASPVLANDFENCRGTVLQNGNEVRMSIYLDTTRKTARIDGHRAEIVVANNEWVGATLSVGQSRVFVALDRKSKVAKVSLFQSESATWHTEMKLQCE